ncbi:hypothetical protein MTBUT4_200025 [Magnetospirillum sp. UT-4]|nr:hypothetical protein MTBUT4_200025 [Magnetospirillum sp. UT-4]
MISITCWLMAAPSRASVMSLPTLSRVTVISGTGAVSTGGGENSKASAVKVTCLPPSRGAPASNRAVRSAWSRTTRIGSVKLGCQISSVSRITVPLGAEANASFSACDRAGSGIAPISIGAQGAGFQQQADLVDDLGQAFDRRAQRFGLAGLLLDHMGEGLDRDTGGIRLLPPPRPCPGEDRHHDHHGDDGGDLNDGGGAAPGSDILGGDTRPDVRGLFQCHDGLLRLKGGMRGDLPGEGLELFLGGELGDCGFGLVARHPNELALGIDVLEGRGAVQDVPLAGALDLPVEIGDALRCFGLDPANQGGSGRLEFLTLPLGDALIIDPADLVVGDAVIAVDDLAIDELEPVTQHRLHRQIVVALGTDDAPVIAVGEADFAGHDQMPPMIGTM